MEVEAVALLSEATAQVAEELAEVAGAAQVMVEGADEREVRVG